MANSADPDQLASSEANWSESTQFAKTGHVMFSRIRVNIDVYCCCRQRTYSNMLSLQTAAQSSTAHHILTVLRANIQILEEVNHLCRDMRKCTFWCASSKDSNQPAHPCSLIRVFVVRLKKLCIIGYPYVTSDDSDQTVNTSRLIWIFTGRLHARFKVHYLMLQLFWARPHFLQYCICAQPKTQISLSICTG